MQSLHADFLTDWESAKRAKSNAIMIMLFQKMAWDRWCVRGINCKVRESKGGKSIYSCGVVVVDVVSVIEE